ncbi:MAG: DUF4136 domain-containing protein [Pseudomonadales bacterium]|nr:DUF4136 domain-containing protein [Pseudomonadales bacterium]
MKTLARTAVALCLLWVAGCATQVTSEVTTFHRLASPNGETIAVVPTDEAKTGGIEFNDYAAKVAAQLSEIGFKPVASDENPQILARFDYGVGPGETHVRSLPDNYVHYHFYYGHPRAWYLGTWWDEPEVYSYTVYPRYLDLTLIRASDGEVLFEGHVKSAGREDNMNEVVDYLIDAMFQNFPGESGVTKIVTIRKGDDDRPM